MTKHGFDHTLIKNLDTIWHRIEMDKAAMIIIDGGVGEGKTTLACEIAEYYQPGWIEDRSKELLTMGGDEFMKGLDAAVKNNDKVVVYDEAGDFNTRNALTQFNQRLNRIFETYRQTKKLIILCLPDFTDVDKSLMKKKIPRLLIHTYSRTHKYGRYKGYGLYRMWYLRYKMTKLTVPQMAYGIVWPNFHGFFHNLSQKMADKIGRHSMSGKKSIISSTYLQQQGLLKAQDAAKRLGITRGTLSRYRKSGLIKETEKTGNRTFYSKEDIDKLSQKLAKT